MERAPIVTLQAVKNGYLYTMRVTHLLAVALACFATRARAQTTDATPAWKLSGYVEADYAHNFNRPSNGINNYRGFDNRSDTITISNVSLAVDWDVRDVVGRIALQVGHTPSTYYASEPARDGGTGANRTDANLWKYIQEAHVGYRFHPWARELVLEAGVFLSPIGPESMIVHQNWTWSRSNLFFGLPFYHTGARAVAHVSDAWTLTLAVYNGWNSVVDDNAQKSLSVSGLYTPTATFSMQLLYFGGVERTKRDPAGMPFRHLFDSFANWHVTRWLALIAQADGGFEPNRFGTTYWGAGALSARFVLHERLALALRGDRLQEHAARDADGAASRLFFPARWVSSGTATLDYHPADIISFRLEYRHDAAASAMYYQHHVVSNERPNARHQDTLTVGVTAWF